MLTDRLVPVERVGRGGGEALLSHAHHSAILELLNYQRTSTLHAYRR